MSNISLWNKNKTIWQKLIVGVTEAVVGAILILILFTLTHYGIWLFNTTFFELPIWIPSIPLIGPGATVSGEFVINWGNLGIFNTASLIIGTAIPVFFKELIEAKLLEEKIKEML